MCLEVVATRVDGYLSNLRLVASRIHPSTYVEAAT